ncbi:hypothetical protein C8R42DRAFT_716806 [Lentinula raphanica]|nr:hypothetical protein C8R42DRAFT_716806 [Lentinula raphanica]
MSQIFFSASQLSSLLELFSRLGPDLPNNLRDLVTPVRMQLRLLSPGPTSSEIPGPSSYLLTASSDARMPGPGLDAFLAKINQVVQPVEDLSPIIEYASSKALHPLTPPATQLGQSLGPSSALSPVNSTPRSPGLVLFASSGNKRDVATQVEDSLVVPESAYSQEYASSNALQLTMRLSDRERSSPALNALDLPFRRPFNLERRISGPQERFYPLEESVGGERESERARPLSRTIRLPVGRPGAPYEIENVEEGVGGERDGVFSELSKLSFKAFPHTPTPRQPPITRSPTMAGSPRPRTPGSPTVELTPRPRTPLSPSSPTMETPRSRSPTLAPLADSPRPRTPRRRTPLSRSSPTILSPTIETPRSRSPTTELSPRSPTLAPLADSPRSPTLLPSLALSSTVGCTPSSPTLALSPMQVFTPEEDDQCCAPDGLPSSFWPISSFEEDLDNLLLSLIQDEQDKEEEEEEDLGGAGEEENSAGDGPDNVLAGGGPDDGAGQGPNPGPAPRNTCGRGGAAAQRKRRRVGRGLEEETDSDPSEDLGQAPSSSEGASGPFGEGVGGAGGEGGGLGGGLGGGVSGAGREGPGGGGEETQGLEDGFLYEATDKPRRPPKHVTDSGLALMLRLTGGTSWGSDQWVAEMCKIVYGTKWEEEGCAFSTDSLLHLAQRCNRAEKIEASSILVRMMYCSRFLYENKTLEEPISSAYPSILKIEQQGISRQKMHDWLNAGSRWARLAGAGTIYLLVIIASQPGLAAKLKSKALVAQVLFELCNEIRFPQDPLNLTFVSQRLAPAILKLQKAIPLRIPVLFSPTSSQTEVAGTFLDCQDVVMSDRYFDSFHSRAFITLQRSKTLWAECLSYSCSLQNIDDFCFDLVTQSHLTQQGISESVASQIPQLNFHFVDSFEISDDEVKLQSWFKETSIPSKLPFSASKSARTKWTEKQRKGASEAIEVDSMSTLQEQLKTRYDKYSGELLKNKKWLKIPSSLFANQGLEIRDQDGQLIVDVNSTLSSNKRQNLLMSLLAWSRAASSTISGVELVSKNSREVSGFTALHFTFFGKYGPDGKLAPKGTHPLYLRRKGGKHTNTSQFQVHASQDMQTFAEEWDLLCCCLEDVIEEVVAKTLKHHSDFFEDIEAEIDIVPLYDSTPARPFRSVVVNLNYSTTAHRDKGDRSGCIVLVIGDFAGGDLCLYEPKLTLEELGHL